MTDTELQLARQQVSDQKQRVLKQQGVVLNLKRQGGKELEAATALWNSMRDELAVMEVRLERLMINS
jgi:hypothetical protein